MNEGTQKCLVKTILRNSLYFENNKVGQKSRDPDSMVFKTEKSIEKVKMEKAVEILF